jgi:hypothetical protein
MISSITDWTHLAWPGLWRDCAIREGVELAQCDVFEQSTIAGIIALVEKALAAPETQPLAPLNPSRAVDICPLPSRNNGCGFCISFIRRALPIISSAPSACGGQLRVSALERALNSILRRHEIYRTTYAFTGDNPTQVIHPHRDLELPLVDYSDLPETEAVQNRRHC